MLADVGQQLIILHQIVISTLRSDLVLWSITLHTAVFFVELTVLWEDATDEAYKRKMPCYTDLKAEAEQRDCLVEVGCFRFTATSTVQLLKDLGICGQALWHAIKEISNC